MLHYLHPPPFGLGQTRQKKSVNTVKAILAVLAALFAGFFILNVYFRIKVFRHYRVLIDNRVEFGAADIFSEARMSLVVDRYPHVRESIEKFCKNMRFTMRMATVFVVLVIIFGFVLLRHR